MKIVHVSPCHETVPPLKDGGTERIIHELSEGLIEAGHQIVLYAPPGSSSSGTLMVYPQRHMSEEEIAHYVARTLPPDTDIVHDHTFTSAVGRMNLRAAPVVCTLHLPSNNGIRHPVYVSRRALEAIGNNVGDYVYNGIRPEQYQFSDRKDSYLLFMGRVIREKGIEHTLDIADRTGLPLVIAGPIHDPALFDSLVKPRIQRNRSIRYVGSVGGQEKQDLLKNARCVLFPSIWEEPFGLVMVEAMACGTPVLALGNGAAREVLERFPQLLCGSPDDIVRKLPIVSELANPHELRSYVMERFTTARMTERYVELYGRIRQSFRPGRPLKPGAAPRTGKGRPASASPRKSAGGRKPAGSGGSSAGRSSGGRRRA